MSDKEKVATRSKEFIEREKANGTIEKVSGVRDDVEKLWTKAKDKAEIELFRWGSVKEDMPKTWELIKKHEAYQDYVTSKSTDGYKWSKSEVYEFNNLATLRYAEIVEGYLKSKSIDDAKKRDYNQDGVSDFQEQIDEMWADAKIYVSDRMESMIKKPR